MIRPAISAAVGFVALFAASDPDLRGTYLQAKKSAVTPGVGAPVGRLAVKMRGNVVPVDHPFVDGDEIQFEVSANQGGWVYVFHRSEKGPTELLWPDPRRAADNYLPPRAPRLIPEDGVLVFDSELGEETFSVVISPTEGFADAPALARPAQATSPGLKVAAQRAAASTPAKGEQDALTTERQILVRDPKAAQQIREGLDAGARGVSFRPTDGDHYVYFGADKKGARKWAIATFRLKHAGSP